MSCGLCRGRTQGPDHSRIARLPAAESQRPLEEAESALCSWRRPHVFALCAAATRLPSVPDGPRAVSNRRDVDAVLTPAGAGCVRGSHVRMQRGRSSRHTCAAGHRGRRATHAHVRARIVLPFASASTLQPSPVARPAARILHSGMRRSWTFWSSVACPLPRIPCASACIASHRRLLSARRSALPRQSRVRT